MLLATLRPVSVRKKTMDQAALISCKLPGQGVYQFSREAVGSGKKDMKKYNPTGPKATVILKVAFRQKDS